MLPKYIDHPSASLFLDHVTSNKAPLKLRQPFHCVFILNYRQRYISLPLNVKDIMHAPDKKLFNKARALSHHTLNEILKKPKPQQYNLRHKVCLCPKINTKRFKITFVNRHIF